MGLIKSIEYESTGMTVDYWKIGGFVNQTDYVTNSEYLSVQLFGYWSKAERDLDKKPVMRQQVYLTGVSKVSEDFRDDLYPAIKLLPEWSDATDDLEA